MTPSDHANASMPFPSFGFRRDDYTSRHVDRGAKGRWRLRLLPVEQLAHHHDVLLAQARDDGLAVGVSTISSVTMFVVALLVAEGNVAVILAALMGACVGFMPYNLNPAKIFMGDTGSLTIGMMLCFLSLKLTMCGLDDNTGNVHPMVLAFSPLLVPCCDVVRVYLHRVRNGKNPFLPDKNHIHHKLLALGIKQRNTMIIIVSVSTIFILLNILLSLYLNVNWIVLGDILIWTLANIRLTKSIAQLQSEQKTNK